MNDLPSNHDHIAANHRHRRRVVITGIGLLTPAGGTLASYWSKIISGTTAIRRIERVDTSNFNFSLGGEVDDGLFAIDELPDEYEKVDRATVLCRVASKRALLDAGLELANMQPNKVGMILGSSMGPTEAVEQSYLAFAQGGARALPPRTVTRSMFNSISAQVAIDLRLSGPQMSIASACSSSNLAMSRAVDVIRNGHSSLVLTGGVDMPICSTILASWSAMRVCPRTQFSAQCSLPFDKRRAGLALAEGAAMFVFEELESANNRGARIYAEVLGYGENNDAIHMTQPDPASQCMAIESALHDAGVNPKNVDYINAHGTATHLNDISETQAIKKCFGPHAMNLPVSSTKSVLGHALGASGALELPAILGAFIHQAVPPTANLLEPDPECDLKHVACMPLNAKVKIAISNSFAFGGSNSVLVLGVI